MSLRTWALAGLAAQLASLVGSLRDLGVSLVEECESRLLDLQRAIRAEVRHAVIAQAIALVAAGCGVLALCLLAFAILLLAGEEHRVLAALLLAAVFAAAAVGAALVVRAQTRIPPPR